MVQRELRFSSGSSFGGGMALSGGKTRWTADKAVEEAYYSNVFVYACVRAIAQDLAARPIRVGADPDKPSDFNPKHPLAVRLSSKSKGGPNPTTSSTQLIRWSIAQKIITGAFAWEIANDLTFWPLLIRLLKPIPNESARPENGWFSGYEYGDGRNKRTFRPAQVFYDFTPGQDDWRLPESSLQAARLDVSVAVMQDQYDHAFLRNDARPATVVVHEAFETEEDKIAFRRNFITSHRGPANAGKTMFAQTSPNGATPKEALLIQTLGLSQRDSRAIERYEAKIRAICIGLGVPLSRLGDASGSTFNNSNVERFNYWQDTIQPTGDELADAFTMHLLPLFDNSGNQVWFDYSGIPDLEPARKFAVADVPNLVNNGIITVNEGRDAIGLGPVDGGDDLTVPADPAPVPAEPVQAADPAPVPVDVAQAVQAAVRPLAAALDDMRTAQARAVMAETFGDEVEARMNARAEYRAKVWRKANAATLRLERTWKRTMQELLDDQRKAALSRLEGKRGRQAVKRDAEDDAAELADAIFDQEFWQARTVARVTPLYESTTAAALTQLDAAFDISFDLDAPWAQEFIAARANMLAGQITATTYDAIKAALADGAAAGESIPDLAARIDGLFSTTWANRATTVARTEVISAYNGSTSTAISNSDPEVIGGMEWIATADDRTREDHADADGMIVGRDETFSVGGDDLAYPGDPSGDPGNVINCRCTVAPVTVDDMPPSERAVPRAHVERLAVQLARGTVDFREALRLLTKP